MTASGPSRTTRITLGTRLFAEEVANLAAVGDGPRAVRAAGGA
jgi:hypothetical protein